MSTVRRAPLWLLALITFSGTLAMHMFVPALPLAALDLDASPGAMQLTISVYIFGLAVGQLVYGPFSDRFGRRPVLMVGLCLYTLAGLASALAPSVDFLIVARLFQALGGCAGLVLGRAMVRDGAEPAAAARRLALMNLMVTLGPGLAPLVGGALANLTGWRSIFYILCGLGVTNLLFAWRMLPETSGGAGQTAASVFRAYRGLFASATFLGYSIIGGCVTTAMFAFVSAAPFIFVNQLGRPPTEVGVYIAVTVGGVWLGSLAASRLAGRVPMDRMLVAASRVCVLGALVFLGAVLAGHLSLPVVMGSMLVFTFGAGIAAPAALTEAIGVNPHAVGSASGVYGFIQMAVGAICTSLASLGSNPALAASAVLVGAGVVGQLALRMALRRRVATPSPRPPRS